METESGEIETLVGSPSGREAGPVEESFSHATAKRLSATSVVALMRAMRRESLKV
jgi:hypothetical protein